MLSLDDNYQLLMLPENEANQVGARQGKTKH